MEKMIDLIKKFSVYPLRQLGILLTNLLILHCSTVFPID
jgi:hypothetical protein